MRMAAQAILAASTIFQFKQSVEWRIACAYFSCHCTGDAWHRPFCAALARILNKQNVRKSGPFCGPS